MDEKNKPIICFEHCPGKKLFGFFVLRTCSFCQADLTISELHIPPFRLPSPFKEAAQNPCSVVLKPTKGNFLLDYKNSDNLHIGLVSSKSIIYEYDEDGLKSDDGRNWANSLVINFKKGKGFSIPSQWSQYWDFTLESILASQKSWTKEMYNEEDHNCYTFVLTFLRALQSPEISPFAKDKKDFCEHFIVPKSKSAAKYITLYRKLVNESNC